MLSVTLRIHPYRPTLRKAQGDLVLLVWNDEFSGMTLFAFFITYAKFIIECIFLLCVISCIELSITYLDTWSGFEAAKTAPWPSRGLHHCVVNSLSPQMSELVEDAIASSCGDIVRHFWLVRNGVEKLVELKFEFFSFNIFDVPQIFW